MNLNRLAYNEGMKFTRLLPSLPSVLMLALLLPGVHRCAAKPQAVVAAGFDGERSYGYLKELCALGNRMSGSPGMKQQQALVEKHFVGLQAKVTYQRFKVRHPLSGKRVPMANLIVEWRPEAKERLLLCAHYDTRPKPDQELNPRIREKGIFLGANDRC